MPDSEIDKMGYFKEKNVIESASFEMPHIKIKKRHQVKSETEPKLKHFQFSGISRKNQNTT